MIKTLLSSLAQHAWQRLADLARGLLPTVLAASAGRLPASDATDCPTAVVADLSIYAETCGDTCVELFTCQGYFAPIMAVPPTSPCFSKMGGRTLARRPLMREDLDIQHKNGGIVFVFSTLHAAKHFKTIMQAVLATKVGTGNLLQPTGVVQTGLFQLHVFVCKLGLNLIIPGAI